MSATTNNKEKRGLKSKTISFLSYSPALIIFFHVCAYLFCCRQNPLPYDDRLNQGMDAGYIFSQREDWPISQHTSTKSIRESVPKWRRSLQYTCVTHMCLFYAPGALPSGHADLQSRCGQL